MASKWSNIAGTVLGYFRLGVSGVRLKNSSGSLSVRNANDSADAVVLPQSLGTGARDGTKYLRDDGAWVTLDAILAKTSTPALTIKQTGSGNALLIEDSASPDATPFIIDNSGRHITGYTSFVPSFASITPSLQHHGLGSAESALAYYNWNAASSNPIISFNKSDGGATGTRGIVPNGRIFGRIGWGGDDGTNFIQAAEISASVDGTPATNDMPGRLVFSTTLAGSSSPTERMRIGNEGRVGIGGTAAAGTNLFIRRTIPSTESTTPTSLFVQNQYSGTFTSAASYQSQIRLDPSATITTSSHFKAGGLNMGVGAVVTTQISFEATNTGVGATNNYGFFGNLASASGSWNFYANGTANNAFNGNSSFGKVSVPNASIDCTSLANSFVTNSAATYTVLTTDHTIIQTTAGATYTLPAASSFTNRVLHIVTQFAGAVISASSNVVPIAGGAAGTAILSATAGKYAKLQSNGTNWVIIEAN